MRSWFTLGIILFVTCYSIAAEDESSIVLSYQSSGSISENGATVPWDQNFEDPGSDISKLWIGRVNSQVTKALETLSHKPENMTTVFWNNTDNVWVDFTFYIQTSDWANTNNWTLLISRALSNTQEKYYVENYKLAAPAYLSFIKDAEYVVGPEGTPYKTSYTVSLVMNCDTSGWSNEWFNTSSTIYRQKCHLVHGDVDTIYQGLNVVTGEDSKCLFWAFNGVVRVVTPFEIMYNTQRNLTILDNNQNFNEFTSTRFDTQQSLLYLVNKLRSTMVTHTTPVQLPRPAVAPATSTATTNPTSAVMTTVSGQTSPATEPGTSQSSGNPSAGTMTTSSDQTNSDLSSTSPGVTTTRITTLSANTLWNKNMVLMISSVVIVQMLSCFMKVFNA